VRTLYIHILIGHLETQAMTLQVSASEQSLKENADAVLAGNLLEARVLRKDEPAAGEVSTTPA